MHPRRQVLRIALQSTKDTDFLCLRTYEAYTIKGHVLLRTIVGRTCASELGSGEE